MQKILTLLLFTRVFFLVPVAFSEEKPKENSDSGHHIAMSFGSGFVQNKTLNKYYNAYLDKKVGTQGYFAIRYQFLNDTKGDYSSGFSLDLFNASSEQSRSYNFGDVKVGFKMMGLAAGWGLRQRILVEHLYFTAGAQLGLIEEDVTVSTPAGDVEYKDFQAKRDLDSLVLKIACGVRWDFWKTLGLKADVELARVATGDQLLALSAGVGYGI